MREPITIITKEDCIYCNGTGRLMPYYLGFKEICFYCHGSGKRQITYYDNEITCPHCNRWDGFKKHHTVCGWCNNTRRINELDYINLLKVDDSKDVFSVPKIKPETIEILGKKYKKEDVVKRLKRLKEIK